MTFRIIDEPDRVSAVDEDDIEIVGAYRRGGHNYFLLYATQLTTLKTGSGFLTTPRSGITARAT